MSRNKRASPVRTVEQDIVTDKEGHDISRGDEVQVGEPLAGDLHEHEFTGQVVDVDPERGIVCVVDQEDNCFEVDSYNVSLVA